MKSEFYNTNYGRELKTKFIVMLTISITMFVLYLLDTSIALFDGKYSPFIEILFYSSLASLSYVSGLREGAKKQFEFVNKN